METETNNVLGEPSVLSLGIKRSYPAHKAPLINTMGPKQLINTAASTTFIFSMYMLVVYKTSLEIGMNSR